MTIPNELAKLALFIVVLCDFLITAKRTNNERRENSLAWNTDVLHVETAGAGVVQEIKKPPGR
ncbi:hypothetical protein F3J29_19425 [Enterobacter sp. Cy-643]|uniref:hypothetical protein n=1 Tax=Enterobacter sp. Cy-643 TaxID=2608346 RepID=UPI001424220E|nr:hypothetical protein [Enterobacter sp. Cy-643]NIF34299.1 hypothetical protein [Enterobacter sp. Cy-643]